MRIPSHLPEALTVTLWDFSWYTRTCPGEPFHDLDRAFTEAVERGYNTVRICAAPLLLFGEHDIACDALAFANMGGRVGQRTRWYDARGGAVLDLRDRLLELFGLARDHDMYVIISSWEYQQSPAFLAERSWWDMLSGIPAQQRHLALAKAESAMVSWLDSHGLKDRIAYVELHNEVDLSHLADVAAPGQDVCWAQHDLIGSALDVLQNDHPDVLSTVCYGQPPFLDMAAIPRNAQVLHAHIYVYGVLGAIDEWAGTRDISDAFPSPELRSLLRDDAPELSEWPAAIEPWRLEATGIGANMFYAHDWIDTVAWDAWLYEHYQEHVRSMRDRIRMRLQAFATEAAHRDVPAAVGEGWIGYTPLEAEFEDGPAGQVLAGRAVELCRSLGFWATLPGSNSAPQHPSGWRNVEFQKTLNARFMSR
ncbi:hypothetical protein JS278_02949 [Acidipropionibacterium virtanenii]|uniref:Sugar-binding cellulase-like protein n=2 Tax=Acidipropionibacterium virtanenii TaxID=2057246 RepID=A0A344UXT5_9ACTN|nr:hypothetical protein JS278_02949 [Acidipropionibacterium virtanenii]